MCKRPWVHCCNSVWYSTNRCSHENYFFNTSDQTHWSPDLLDLCGRQEDHCPADGITNYLTNYTTLCEACHPHPKGVQRSGSRYTGDIWAGDRAAGTLDREIELSVAQSQFMIPRDCEIYQYDPPLPAGCEPPPATMQKPLHREFFISARGKTDSAATRYLEVVDENRNLADPITYETLEDYQARQTQSRNRHDQKLIEGDYWTWYLTKRNRGWYPSTDHHPKNPNYWIPEDHQWLIGHAFNFPSNWKWDAPHQLNATVELVRRRSLVVYSQAPSYPEPLPLESRGDFKQRQHRYCSALAPARDLDSEYSVWLAGELSRGVEPRDIEGDNTRRAKEGRFR